MLGAPEGGVVHGARSQADLAGIVAANGIAFDGEAIDFVNNLGAVHVATIIIAPMPLPGAAPLPAGGLGRPAAPPAPGLIRDACRRRVSFEPAASMFGADPAKGAPMQLSCKTAIVTGSNSGIGLGIARELARAGASVVLNSYTDTQDDHALAESVAQEFGVKARYVRPISRTATRRGAWSRRRAPATSSSTTPAYSTSRRSPTSRLPGGTR